MPNSMIRFLTDEPVPKELQETLNRLQESPGEDQADDNKKRYFILLWILIIFCIFLLATYIYWMS